MFLCLTDELHISSVMKENDAYSEHEKNINVQNIKAKIKTKKQLSKRYISE